VSKKDRASFREYDEGVTPIYLDQESPKIEVRSSLGTLILCLQDTDGNKFWVEMEDFYGAHLAHDLIEMTRDVDEYGEDGELT
jgi:hypothetical protein